MKRPFPHYLRKSSVFACAAWQRHASAQSLDSLDLATIPQELDSEGCPKGEAAGRIKNCSFHYGLTIQRLSRFRSQRCR